MSDQFKAKENPRVIVIQKLYSYHLNKETEITFPKHRYKKFIKDVVNGTIERKELIQELIDKNLEEMTKKLSAIERESIELNKGLQLSENVPMI